MRKTLELAKLAGRAEMLRWRLVARRTAMRATLLLAGTLFLVAALVLLHALALAALAPHLGDMGAAAAVLAFDLVAALILIAAGLRLGPGTAEREAAMVREIATAELQSKADTLRLAGSLLAMFRRKHPR